MLTLLILPLLVSALGMGKRQSRVSFNDYRHNISLVNRSRISNIYDKKDASKPLLMRGYRRLQVIVYR